jgi:hypothetical protein
MECKDVRAGISNVAHGTGMVEVEEVVEVELGFLLGTRGRLPNGPASTLSRSREPWATAGWDRHGGASKGRSDFEHIITGHGLARYMLIYANLPRCSKGLERRKRYRPCVAVGGDPSLSEIGMWLLVGGKTVVCGSSASSSSSFPLTQPTPPLAYPSLCTITSAAHPAHTLPSRTIGNTG